MFGLGLLVVAWACGLLAFASATGSSVEPLEAPDECARCFAENERLTGRIEQLVVRVGQLEAELAVQRGDGQGGAVLSHVEYAPCRPVPCPCTQRYERCHAGATSMSALAVSAPASPRSRARGGSRRKLSAGTRCRVLNFQPSLFL
jgi:hypothetical protein